MAGCTLGCIVAAVLLILSGAFVVIMSQAFGICGLIASLCVVFAFWIALLSKIDL